MGPEFDKIKVEPIVGFLHFDILFAELVILYPESGDLLPLSLDLVPEIVSLHVPLSEFLVGLVEIVVKFIALETKRFDFPEEFLHLLPLALVDGLQQAVQVALGLIALGDWVNHQSDFLHSHGGTFTCALFWQ
jgi:hypothetical protein